MQDDKDAQAGWVFKSKQDALYPSADTEGSTSSSSRLSTPDALVSWSASEYIANPKNTSWFMLLGLATVLLVGVVYFLTHDVVSVVVIIILSVLVGILAGRQPRTLEYTLDRTGLTMGAKSYPYGYFKSFSIVQEEVFSHVSLLPLKRFMPPLVIHYLPEDEKKIIAILSDFLPHQEHKRDIIDNFSRRVRF